MGSFNDFLDAEFRPPRNWSLNAPLKFKSETLTNEVSQVNRKHRQAETHFKQAKV